nr:hypothetical protein [Tanacetum cinerariifolium]
MIRITRVNKTRLGSIGDGMPGGDVGGCWACKRENYFVAFKVKVKVTVTTMVGVARFFLKKLSDGNFIVNCGGMEKVEKPAGGLKQWAVVVYVVPVGPMFLGRMLCSRQVRPKLGASRTWTWYGLGYLVK